MIKNLYVVRKSSLFVFLFYFLSPLQPALATVWEYSISEGWFYFFDPDGYAGSTMELTGTVLIDDEHYNLEDPYCITYFNGCGVQFNLTYFDMYVGDEFHFTGTSGFIKYGAADTYSYWYGTGDWSSMSLWRNDGTMFSSYEEWRAFQLPSTILHGSNTSDGLTDLSPALVSAHVGSYGFSLERVGSVPVPAAVWLFGSGLIGLIGLARRKAA